jgi:alpha-galactosidase
MSIYTTEHGWVLETQTTAYALGVNPTGLVVHRYWGARLPYVEDYIPASQPGAWASFNAEPQLMPEEYPGYGDMKYIDPCLKVTFADGVRDVVLRFERAEVQQGDTPELAIHLHDAQTKSGHTGHI